MGKHKPVSDDELVRLMFRIEEVGANAALIARRLHATRSPVETPADRAASVAVTVGALADLVGGMLHWSCLEEQQFADEQHDPHVGGRVPAAKAAPPPATPKAEP